MTLVTMRFKDAITELGGAVSFTESGTLLNNAIPVGLGSYPIFDPAYRIRLNGLIVDRYYNREIGLESVPMFGMALRRRMNEIMPYYNKMYAADAMEFDPLKTVDMTTLSNTEDKGRATTETETEAEQSGNSRDTGTSNVEGQTRTTSESKSRGVTSDTPQTRLKGDEDYASSAADQTGRSEGDGTTTETGSTEQTANSESTSKSNASNSTNTAQESTGNTRLFGYEGSPSELISRYRSSLARTDEQVLAELEDCFLQIFTFDDVPRNFHYSRLYPRF